MNQHTWKGWWRGGGRPRCCRLEQRRLCFGLALFQQVCPSPIVEARLEWLEKKSKVLSSSGRQTDAGRLWVGEALITSEATDTCDRR